MIIERTKDEIIFRLPANLNIDDLQGLADLLEYKGISQKSKVKQSQVDELVSDIKKGRWEKTKNKLGL